MEFEWQKRDKYGRILVYVYPVVALNLALIFIKPLAIKGRLLNQCHLLDSSTGDPVE